MLEALLLDALLTIAILLLIPLGVVRGGLREVCSSAGLLLGILLAQAWSIRWGNTISDLLNVSEKGSRFSIAVLIVVASTAVVGYGGSSAFSYRPGPGGKMFGGAIAVINGVVIAGFIVNSVATYINDGEYPAVVEEGYLTRALSEGFDWVLLLSAGAVMMLSILGMIVREREPADQTWAAGPPSARRASVRQVLPTKPYLSTEPEKIEPATAAENPSGPEYAPVKIREVRHWEEPQPTTRTDSITGWQQTWPRSATGERIRPPWESAEEPPKQPESFRKVPPAHIPITDPTESLKKWVAGEDDSTDPKPRKS
jgi:uncharacterized membrane protein required for colicin V production